MRISQLLVEATREFRSQLHEELDAAGTVNGLRAAHLPVFGIVSREGTRLTELADTAGVTLSTMAEVVDDLEARGYVNRRPDPTDRRAKLIFLTDEGRSAIRPARAIIESIEQDFAALIGPKRFEQMCLALQDLVDALRTRDQSTPSA